MQDGFVKVAAVTPEVRVADVAFNVDACVRAAQTACTVHGAMVVTLPELCLTAYTCEDLFWQDALLSAADKGLADFARRTADLNALLLVGLPVRVNAKLYNCCAVVCGGTILGVVPKRYLPTYNEFYEGRHFVPGTTDVVAIDVGGQLDVPFGTSQLFACDELSELVVAVLVADIASIPLQNPSLPLSYGLIPLLVLFCCELIISGLTYKSIHLRKLLYGRPNFIIERGRRTHNLIHVAGIQSPGLTTAPAVAVDVADMAVSILAHDRPVAANPDFDPHRPGIPVLREMDDETRAAYIAKNPDYGVIVCRCEEISRGEILDALRSNVCVPTVDGVKKRVRPGMGRCQGGFCSPQVVRIIAEFLGVPLSDAPITFGPTKSGEVQA